MQMKSVKMNHHCFDKNYRNTENKFMSGNMAFSYQKNILIIQTCILFAHEPACYHYVTIRLVISRVHWWRLHTCRHTNALYNSDSCVRSDHAESRMHD